MKYNEGHTEWINADGGTYELVYINNIWKVTFSPSDKAEYSFVGKYPKRKQAISAINKYKMFKTK